MLGRMPPGAPRKAVPPRSCGRITLVHPRLTRGQNFATACDGALPGVSHA